MDHLRIIQDIQSGKLAPVYSLMGEEPFFIDAITEVLEHEVLDEAEKAFNLTVVYGRDVSMDQVISTAKSFPMMGARQVIIVREAQAMDDWKKAEKLNGLEHYLDQPQPSTVLAFAYKGKKIDARLKAGKKLKAKGEWFVSARLREQKIPTWVKGYMESKGHKITDKASYVLSEYLGNDLGKLSGALDKLIIAAPQGEDVTVEHIERNIGISKDYNVFELQRALSTKDIVKSNRILNYFIANPKAYPIQMLLPVLYSYFSKLLLFTSLKDKSSGNVSQALKIPPFVVNDYVAAGRNYSFNKVARIISYIRDCDRKSKGVGVTNRVEHGTLMKELIFKILH